jgi:hypothetical protein
MQPPERHARLVLISSGGTVLGQLAPFPVATPWWQDIAPVVRGARQHHDIEVVVLRLLEAELAAPPGGTVTYLAQVAASVPAEPWPGRLDDHPLRLPYARLHGPAADLAWADSVLASEGLVRTRAEQVRTWNLSSLWRLEAGERAFWLKVVPPFFAHEGALLARLAGKAVPALLAHEAGRMLLPELPGDDLHGAPVAVLTRMISLAVDLQASWIGRVDELLALGAADFRAVSLPAAFGRLVEREASALAPPQRAALHEFVEQLPGRMSDIASCGIPEALVHGDLHPGNFRGSDEALALLDWGDAGAGHPLLDQAAFLQRAPRDALAGLRAHWNELWRARIPGCDPGRAARLLGPVAAARQALIYRRFLDAIEPAEHPYHRADPAGWLVRCAVLLREESAASHDA